MRGFSCYEKSEGESRFHFKLCRVNTGNELYFLLSLSAYYVWLKLKEILWKCGNRGLGKAVFHLGYSRGETWYM